MECVDRNKRILILKTYKIDCWSCDNVVLNGNLNHMKYKRKELLNK